MAMTEAVEEIYTPPAPAYTDRDFALYEAIIVRRNKTVPATQRVDKKGVDDNETQTWAQHGLMPERFK